MSHPPHLESLSSTLVGHLLYRQPLVCSNRLDWCTPSFISATRCSSNFRTGSIDKPPLDPFQRPHPHLLHRSGGYCQRFAGGVPEEYTARFCVIVYCSFTSVIFQTLPQNHNCMEAHLCPHKHCLLRCRISAFSLVYIWPPSPFYKESRPGRERITGCDSASSNAFHALRAD